MKNLTTRLSEIYQQRQQIEELIDEASGGQEAILQADFTSLEEEEKRLIIQHSELEKSGTFLISVFGNESDPESVWILDFGGFYKFGWWDQEGVINYVELPSAFVRRVSRLIRAGKKSKEVLLFLANSENTILA